MFVLLLSYISSVSHGQTPPNTRAIVKGKATDSADAGIPEVLVDFNKGRKHYAVRTSAVDSGTYSIVLSPGKYHVSAEARGFRGWSHSEFVLRKGELIDMNLVLHPCATDQAVTSDGKGGIGCGWEEQLPPMKDGYRPLVKYVSRQEHRGVIQFNSAVYSDYPVTVMADKLIYRQKSNSIVAVGNVTYLKGKETRHLSNVELSSVNGEQTAKFGNESR